MRVEIATYRELLVTGQTAVYSHDCWTPRVHDSSLITDASASWTGDCGIGDLRRYASIDAPLGQAQLMTFTLCVPAK